MEKRIITPERSARVDEVVKWRNFSQVLVLENLYDRGNVSAVLRTAEALGFGEVHIVRPLGAKFKESQRTTAGADKWLDIYQWTSIQDCLSLLRRDQGRKILATDLGSGSIPLSSLDSLKTGMGPLALVLGNEKDGISPEARELADVRVHIPMVGFVRSFNISVAAAILLYHLSLFREGSSFLTVADQARLREKYISR